MDSSVPKPSTGPPWLGGPDVFALDRFQVGPILGQGAMGTVHEAWDPVLGRRLALKRLHGTDPDSLQALFQEAQAQARLDHPGICKIYEMGEADGVPFIAMQVVAGKPLGHWAAELSPRAVVAILADVAQAVQAAHAAGLVHRDLKPQNILVEQRADGSYRPVVVDFGLAMDLRSSEAHLAWGLAGTPAFMGPEQAKGEPLTCASDVYSLGATLFAMLSGRPPFEAMTLAGLFEQQAAAPAPRLRRVAPGAPKALEPVLAKCLEPDPGRRYPCAGALEADLRRILAGLPPLGRPSPWTYRLAWALRRNRRDIATLAATGLVAGLLTLGSVPRIRQARVRMALAQRFGFDLGALESDLKVERLLPSHDVQPAEQALAVGLDHLRGQMLSQGPAALGAGHYALGRGRLLLFDWLGALREFREAQAAGYRTPELTYAMGWAHFALYLEGRWPEPGRPPAPAAVQAGHRDRALALLSAGRGAALEPAPLASARLALLRGSPDLCLEACEQALREDPALIAAHLLAAQARLAQALARPDQRGAADMALTLASQRLEQAQGIARSDPGPPLWRLRLANAQLEVQEASPDRRRFPSGAHLAREALALRPADPDLWRAAAALLDREARLRARQGEADPGWCRDQLAFLAGAPAGVDLGPALGDLRALARDGGAPRLLAGQAFQPARTRM